MDPRVRSREKWDERIASLDALLAANCPDALPAQKEESDE